MAKHTRRNSSGEPEAAAIEAKESYGAELECALCGRPTGQPVVGRDGEHLYNRRPCHFKIDHTKHRKPSWLGTNDWRVLLEQLENGDAQVLCLRCEANKTYDAPPGQGTSHNYTTK